MRIRPSHVALVLTGVILGLAGFLLAFTAADYAPGMTTVTLTKKKTIRPEPVTVAVTATVTETTTVTKKANLDRLLNNLLYRQLYRGGNGLAPPWQEGQGFNVPLLP